jgi:hypothetical protein
MNTADAVRFIVEMFAIAAAVTIPLAGAIVYLGERDLREREHEEHHRGAEMVPHP